MIERADSDGDGYVTFEDFYTILTKKTFAWILIAIYHNYNIIEFYYNIIKHIILAWLF